MAWYRLLLQRALLSCMATCKLCHGGIPRSHREVRRVQLLRRGRSRSERPEQPIRHALDSLVAKLHRLHVEERHIDAVVGVDLVDARELCDKSLSNGRLI